MGVEEKSQTIVMSRYPSAYGHTPTYRSVASTVYPSALGRDPLDVPASLSGLGARSTLDREFDRSFERDFSSRREFEKDFSRREFEKDFSCLDSDLNFSSGLGARSALSDLEHDLKFSSLASRARSPLSTSHSGSSSTYKAEKYSSSTSSTNGGLPHRESHHDSTYRSTRVGDSGIPHTSYGHSSSSYDSDRPYKNAVSNFSYNI